MRVRGFGLRANAFFGSCPGGAHEECRAARGHLLTPKSKPTAFVLIIPGSGPTDRDGNSPMGVRGSTYRLLAEGLASRGVATLRIDKRGMYGSAGAAKDANAVTIADYGDDVQAWVTRARVSSSCRT